MLIQWKNIIGMILCIMIFSASVPVLMGVKTSPDSMFKGEDVLTLSQTNTNTRIQTNLAEILNEQDFVDVASPEIYAFTQILNRRNNRFEPVVVRGVIPNKFLALEDADMVKGEVGTDFLLMGKGFSNKMGIDLGDSLTVPGSTSMAIMEFTVSGIFSSDYSSNDQILIPLEHARKLMGLEGEDILTIRLKTEDRDRLIQFLEDEEYSVIVSGRSEVPIPVNQNKTYKQRVAEDLAIRYTDASEFSASNQSFVSTFIQKGLGNIGVVVIGFITLIALLTFVGITAILARAVIERRKDIGILAAIGADKKSIYMIILKDLLRISTIASGAGVIIGFIVALIVQELGLIVAFGHTIQPAIDLFLFALTFVIAIIIGCISGLMVSYVIMTTRPSKLIQDIEDMEEAAETENLVDLIGV